MELSEHTRIFLRISAGTVVWSVLHWVMTLILPIPKQIRELAEKDSQRSKFHHYVSYYPGLLHGSLSTFLALLVLVETKWEFGGPACVVAKSVAYYSASYFVHDFLFGMARKYN